MEQRQRKTVRARRDQLLTLVNGWDPAGVLAAGAPRHQYDALVDKLLGVLSNGATKEQVAEFLDTELRDEFDVTPEGVLQFATKAVTWFQMLESAQ